MKAPVIALAALLAIGANAHAKNSIVFQTTQLAPAAAQLSGAAGQLVSINVMEKIDYAKADNMRPSSSMNCKTQFMPYGNPGYLSICSQNMVSDNGQFRVEVKLITRGTAKGLRDQARYGLAMPSEMKMEMFKQCMTPHFTVINASNNVVVVNEASNDCSDRTIDVEFVK
jgi:hypothetical protein